MAENRPRQQEEGEPNGAPAWMVTFSDCMTLLLCFFVLLLTFSSFDQVSLDRLGGAFPGLSYDSVFPNKQTVMDSAVPPKPKEMDFTSAGSEMPTDSPPTETVNPRPVGPSLPPDAYKDCKTVRIPSDMLFYARGAALTEEGKALAGTLAGFVRRMPCKIVLSESCSVSADGRPDRALALVRYLTGELALPEELFSVAASRTGAPAEDEGRPTMVITMINGELYK
jgi:hypothetical protein